MVLIALGLALLVAVVLAAILLSTRAHRRRMIETSPPAAPAGDGEASAASASESDSDSDSDSDLAEAEADPEGKEDAERVKVEVSLSDGVSVEITNHGSHPIHDVVLSRIRHRDHPDWTWRPGDSGANDRAIWWRIAPGESARCRVEFVDGDGSAVPAPAVHAFEVQAFWSDRFDHWWVLTADVLRPPSGHGTGDAPANELPRLTPAEDSELRQLAWFASAGQLSEESQARLAELKARDRRKTVRDARPDPVSRHTDRGGPRLAPSAPRSSRCRNCAFEVHGAGLPGFCPSCGHPLAASQTS